MPIISSVEEVYPNLLDALLVPIAVELLFKR